MYRHTHLVLVAAAILLITVGYLVTTTDHVSRLNPFLKHPSTPSHPHQPTPPPPPPRHPIEDLIEEADRQFARFESERTYTLEDAAAAYRKRRGRHPPPGFDLWYEYARKNDTIIVEEFWDQIYDDLNPFWAVDPALLRAQARKLGLHIKIKGGKVVEHHDWFWHETWADMIDTFAEFLPDMVLAMNAMDESRLLVQWTEIDRLMGIVNEEKSMTSPENTTRTVKGWTVEDEEIIELPDRWEEWNGYNPYAMARRACPPDTAAAKIAGSISADEILSYRNNPNAPIDAGLYFDGGFVKNYTAMVDYCNDPSIGNLHGALMMPISTSNSEILMPLFGGSKFTVNNEILLPAPMYWKEGSHYGGDDPTPWSRKTNSLTWRGAATGGRSKPFTRYSFHRHRFVAITNSTRAKVARQTGHDPIFNELFQESAIKPLQPETQQVLSDWLKSIHDVGFTDLVCDQVEPDGRCWYLDDEYEKLEQMPFEEVFKSKYLPDIDGNSFSGRYRAFLLSHSVPIKTTIYREWHDSRLVAWKHFIPMNNRYSDYYRILEYFMGTPNQPGHDHQGQKIATDGREWGEKVLRRVDMQIYTFRLLLEYARIMDDDGPNIGWVDDLLTSPIPS